MAGPSFQREVAHRYGRRWMVAGCLVTVVVLAWTDGFTLPTSRADDSEKEQASPTAQRPRAERPQRIAPVTPVGAEPSDARDRELDRTSRQLAQQVRSRPVGQKAITQAELLKRIEEHFDYRQTQRQAEINRLSDRVEALKRQQQRRHQNKTNIVNRRLKELLDPNADLNWDEVQPNSGDSNTEEVALETLSGEDHIQGPQRGNRPVPKYNNRSLDEYLETLRVEHSPSKLSDSIDALRYLMTDANAEELIDAVFDVLRRRSRLNEFDLLKPTHSVSHQTFLQAVVITLSFAPPELVARRLIRELNSTAAEPLSGTMIVAIYQLTGVLAASAPPTPESTTLPRSTGAEYLQSMSKHQIAILRSTYFRHARRLVELLNAIATRQPESKEWTFACAGNLLEAYDLPPSEFLGFVAQTREIFNDESSSYRDLAADLLARGGLDAKQILAFSETELSTPIITESTRQVSLIARRIANLYSFAPNEVEEILQRLRRNPRGTEACDRLIAWLGCVGVPAKPSIPFLQQLSEQSSVNLQKTIQLAIHRLETAEPKPVVELPPAEFGSPIDVRSNDDGAPDSMSNGPMAKPTYKDVTLDKWMAMLETERSPESLATAIEAIQFLISDADPKVVMRTVLEMSRRRSGVSPLNNSEGSSSNLRLTHLVTELFLMLPPEIVVQSLIEELENSQAKSVSPGFQATLYYLTSLTAKVTMKAEFLLNGLSSKLHQATADGAQALRQELRRRSRRIEKDLAALANRNSAQQDWALACAANIALLSEQPIATYPELIPLAKSVLNDPKSSQRSAAADLLTTGGIDAAEVLLLSEEQLQELHFSGNYVPELNRITQRIARLYTVAPDEVKRIISDRVTESRQGGDWGRRGEMGKRMIRWLADLGVDAQSAIPFLKELEDKPNSIDLKNAINLSIRIIETAEPRPVSEPLPEDDSAPDPVAPATSKPAATEELTFDGVPYSQWRKMLETERKPTKLASAMEACGRLAQPQDHQRIIDEILIATRMFQPGNLEERDLVWNAGRAALDRLPPERVTETVLDTLEDPSFNGQLGFVADFLVIDLTGNFNEKPSAMTRELRQRAGELIPLILQHVRGVDSNRDELLSAAASAWRYADSPVSDFEGLLKSLLKAVDQTTGHSPSSNWWNIASTLVEKAPETPDLAVLLLKSPNLNSGVIDLVAKLGRRAEPAVPRLVELFAQHWKEWCNGQVNPPIGGRGAGGMLQLGFSPSNNSDVDMLVRIVHALGEIGTGPEGYALLQQVRLSTRNWSGWAQTDLYSLATIALRKYEVPASPPVLDKPVFELLIINGLWSLKHSSSAAFSKEATADIRGRSFSFHSDRGVDNDTIFRRLVRFELDESKSPKQVSFAVVPNRNIAPDANAALADLREEGIYELTETTLRIQLSRANQPRPTKFATSDADLPEGQYLLEFERKPLD